MSGGLFTDAARQLAAQGWHPIPIPPRSKAPPPDGFTGTNGIDADSSMIERWCIEHPDWNIGVRLSTQMIGVDVDDYGDKQGAATLAALCKRAGIVLPPTISVTARGKGASRTYLYRVAEGTKLPGVLGPGVDVLQHHHRYMVAPWSIHPELGTAYEWWTSTMMTTRAVPHINQAVLLSSEIIEAIKVALGAQRQSDNGEHEQVQTLHELMRTNEFTDSIAAIITDEHDWHQVLIADGWTMLRDQQQQSMWMRPDKTDVGVSAVLHEPHGPFVVFTTSMPRLQHAWAVNRDGAGWAYSMFGYITATRFDGNRSRCASDYRKARNADERRSMTMHTASIAAAVIDEGDVWSMFHHVALDDPGEWNAADVDDDWLAWPLVPRGAAVALYAPAKAGKSALVLAMVAAAVLGRSIFGHPAAPPIRVGYLDYEMRRDDLFARLDELGYGPHSGLGARLVYASLPSTPPLDRPEGAELVVKWATEHRLDLVVIDTFTRAVIGAENDADTVRSFFRYTGAALKHAGIAVLRTDHSGKDIERGQRGSSSKADDVDIVWQYTRTQTGADLKATHRRMSWVPELIKLSRNDDDGIVVWKQTEHAVPAGTAAMIEVLDQYGIDVDASGRDVQRQLKAKRKMGANNTVVVAAQRARRERRDGAVIDTLSGEQMGQNRPEAPDDAVSRKRSDESTRKQSVQTSSEQQSRSTEAANSAQQSRDGSGCEYEVIALPSDQGEIEPFEFY